VPLTQLTYKDKLDWNQEAENASQTLKKGFTIAPILTHLDFLKSFFMKTNALNFAFRVVLSQLRINRKLPLVAFHSRKFNATEINYEIHDKELLAIVYFFQK